MFITREKILFAYTGDTMIDSVLEQNDFLKAETLVMECTHLNNMSSESTHKHQHIHVDDILKNKNKFKCKNLVLIHFSSRYYDGEKSIVRELLEKIDFFKQMEPINVHLFDELPLETLILLLSFIH